jgi:anti-sigma factor RsiW
MECNRDRETIAAFVDGELGPAALAELESHLETCAGCRELVAAERRLGELFSALAPVTPSGDFEARFWARIAREREAATGGIGARLARLFSVRRALVFGAVTAVALVLALNLSRSPSEVTPSAGPTASAKPDPDVRIVKSEKDFELLQDPDMDAITEVDVLEDWDDASPG